MARFHATILVAALTGLCAGCFETTDTPTDAVVADDSTTLSEVPAELPADVPDALDVPPEAAGCPSTIQPNSACTGTDTCSLGQECCCGQCHPSMVCTCDGAHWGCYETDACMIPPDSCPADVIEAPAEVAIEVAPDVPTDATLPDGMCHSASDCAQSQFCQAPGDPQPCGICMHPQKSCGADVDCLADGQVCEWFTGPCACQQEQGCVPKCGTGPTDSPCSAIQVCNDAGHCVDKTCVHDSDCPKNFTCPIMNMPRCFRMTCTADAGCPDGRCVNGTCRDDLGTCMYPVP